jgi:hypothetical protein
MVCLCLQSESGRPGAFKNAIEGTPPNATNRVTVLAEIVGFPFSSYAGR